MICQRVRLSDFCDKFIAEFQDILGKLNEMADSKSGMYLIYIRLFITTLEEIITRLIRQKEEAVNLERKWKALLERVANLDKKFRLLAEQAGPLPPSSKPDFNQHFKSLNLWVWCEYADLMSNGLGAKSMFANALDDVHRLLESEWMIIIGTENREFEEKRILTGKMCKIASQVCNKAKVEQFKQESDRQKRIKQSDFRLDVRQLQQPGPVLMELQLQEDSTWILPTTCRTPASQSSNVLCLDVRSHVHSTHPEVSQTNEFEKLIRGGVRQSNELVVSFDEIGGLDTIKETLWESVINPIRKVEGFKSSLLKPSRGILLFGPHGTGKSMIAKALAKECKASLLNISIATITSKWFGESEKIVQTLFRVATEVSPTIIFLDGVDNILGEQAMHTIKSEFMASWDRSLEASENIVVVAATNEPFKLDKTVIQRFERRIMVGLPSIQSREKIMRTLLAKEAVNEAVDFKGLAALTEGFSGSDLKDLCTRVAQRALKRSIQEQEKSVKEQEERHMEKRRKIEEDQQGEKGVEGSDKADNINTPTLSPFNMEDFRQARQEIGNRFQADGDIMADLKRWNDLHGEGCAGKKDNLSYFL